MPVFYGASATSSNPVESFAKLIGVPRRAVTAITESTAARGETAVVLWEPELLPPQKNRPPAAGARKDPAGGPQIRSRTERPRRLSPIEQGAQMLTDLVLSRTRSLVFAELRRSVEVLSQKTQRYLDEVEPGLAHRVAAYRAGYTPEERRELERRLPQRRAPWPGQHLRTGAGYRHFRAGRGHRGRLARHPAHPYPAHRQSRTRQPGRARRSIADDNRSIPTWCLPEAILGRTLKPPFSTQPTPMCSPSALCGRPGGPHPR